jgi:hypothetical protein
MECLPIISIIVNILTMLVLLWYASETRKMAKDVQFQRRQETIKAAILVALLGNNKSAEQIAKETPFTVKEIKPVIVGLMGPMGLLQDFGKNQEGEQVFKYREHIKTY